MTVVSKVYRLDLNLWETKKLYNNSVYWFLYEIFGQKSFEVRKRLKSKTKLRFITKAIPCRPSEKIKNEVDLWIENKIKNEYMSGRPVK